MRPEIGNMSGSELKAWFLERNKGLSKTVLYGYSRFFPVELIDDDRYFLVTLQDPHFEEFLYNDIHTRAMHAYDDMDKVDEVCTRTMTIIRKLRKMIHGLFPICREPSAEEVEHYNDKWFNDPEMDKYRLQEESIDKVFGLLPDNTDLADVLAKVSILNDFYSTNIFSTYEVAKNIVESNLDERLRKGDVDCVEDIRSITISGKQHDFYSFASKYCSHHNRDSYPIYDRNVALMLEHFQLIHGFTKHLDDFVTKRMDHQLRDYRTFKDTLSDFMHFFGLEEFSFKEIDRYLWLLGKEIAPKSYS